MRGVSQSAGRYWVTYSKIDPDGRSAVAIEFKGYQVDTGLGFKLPLGHGGTLTIDDKTGKTKYTEYGRYSPEGKGIIGAKLSEKDGNFRNVSVPDVKIGKDGKPTDESLKKVYDSLSKSAGHGSEVKATMHPDADASKVQGAINSLANNPNREKYSIIDNNCKTVRDDVIKAGEK